MAGANPLALANGDFDGDGKTDLVAAVATSDSVAILLNSSGALPCLSVNDVTVTEGNTGFVNANFTVSLSRPSTQTVRVNYSLSGRTAAGGADFTPVSGRLVFAPGETTKTVAVPVRGDALDETNETYTINLASPSGAAVADGEGLGTITDDDPTPTLSVNDITVVESGPGNLWNFTVSLSAPSGRPVTVQFATANGTAVAGSQPAGDDYFATSGTLTIPAGQPSATVGVIVFGDATFEPDEHFFLNLSNPTNATIQDAQGRAVIPNDDPAPTVSVRDAFQQEGDAGTRTAVFNVELSNPSSRAVSVSFATADNGAKAGSDYVAASGVVTFNPGETQKVVNVSINGDTADEQDEFFLLNLSGPVNAGLGDASAFGLIFDDDTSGPVVQFGSPSSAASEAAGAVTLTVTRTNDLSGAVSVKYATVNGTASDRSDYITATGTLNFAANEGSKTIQLFVVNDRYAEPEETILVVLSDPVGGTLGATSETIVRITSDDAADGQSPVSWDANFDTEFFVRQHYLDFLGREPDAGGLQYWKNQIDECGAVAACAEVRRINVSASFFLSPEFQETGFYALRAQRVAFAKKSADEATRVRYISFIRDARQVGEGFVDGRAGSAQVLEQNKQAYAAQVVSGAGFVSRFPTSQTAEQYVLALYASAEVAPTAAETQQAVDAFNAAGGADAGRVAAFRKVVDSDSVRAAEFRGAFVLMQYFGYMRRNPDEVGYAFWLGKLNHHGGDFVAAEMVKAFITSGEYRQRFGQ